MEINFIVPSIKTGGGYRVIQEIANILSLEHDVTIHSANDGTDNTFYKAPNLKFKKYGPLIKHKYFRMISMLYMLFMNRNKKNVVVSGSVLLPFLFMFKNAFYYVQADDYHLFDDRRLIKNKFLLWLYHKTVKKGFKYKNLTYLFCSEWVYKKYIDIAKRKDVPCRLVYPAIEHNVFFPDKSSKSKKSNKIIIGVVGRRQPMKGLKEFLLAIKNLKKQSKVDFETIIAAPEVLDNMDLADAKVIYPKSDQELAKFYRSCDIFISTSWWEGFGLPALEAMACGCAVITSNNGGCIAYAKNEINCLIYEVKNNRDLERKIDYLLKDSVKRKNIADKGIKESKNFSWEISAYSLYKILNEYNR